MAGISLTYYSTVDRPTVGRPGLFGRLIAALMEAQQRRADREIAAILARHADLPPHVIREQRIRALQSHPLGDYR